MSDPQAQPDEFPDFGEYDDPQPDEVDQYDGELPEQHAGDPDFDAPQAIDAEGRQDDDA